MTHSEGDTMPPDWLNQEFLESVLEKGLRRGKLQFSECNFQLATKKGDNYMSRMFRVNCSLISSKTAKPGQISLVIKCLPAGEAAGKFVTEGELFTKEIKMLSETLPLIQNILNEFGEPSNFFAEMYYHQGPPKDLLIMQDLCQLDFVPADRIKGLDLRHSMMVVESLASFHAASLKATKNFPEITKTYNQNLWGRADPLASKLVLEGTHALAEAMKSWVDASEDLTRNLKNYAEKLAQKVIDAIERREDDTNVIAHGDTWTNNFMFKYKNGLPVALKFVDFQAATYNSPVFDLLYFIFSSIQADVREKHLDLLLSSYFVRFESVCKKIGQPLTLSQTDFKQKFFDRLAFGYAVSIIIFPVTTAEVKDSVELEEVIKSGMGDNIFQSQSFKTGMMSMLPIFIKYELFKFT